MNNQAINIEAYMEQTPSLSNTEAQLEAERTAFIEAAEHGRIDNNELCGRDYTLQQNLSRQAFHQLYGKQLPQTD